MQNSPKIGFDPCLHRSVLEDVCIYNNGILEVSTSRSTANSSNSSNNNTTIISSKLICFNKWISSSNTLFFFVHLVVDAVVCPRSTPFTVDEYRYHTQLVLTNSTSNTAW